MGIDLTLMVADYEPSSFTMIRLHRRRELFETISDARLGSVIPEGVRAHVGPDGRFDLADKDPYGNDLWWTSAESLLRFADHPGVTDNWPNRAAWAYLAAAPAETKIILYFS